MAIKGVASCSFRITSIEQQRRNSEVFHARSVRAANSKKIVASLLSPTDDKPPRVCTLRAFSQDEGDSLAMRSASDSGSLGSSSVFFKQLAISVQATAQAQNFETFSGRFAMVAFAVALGLEVVTGNNVLKGIQVEELGQTVGFSAACAICMAAFAAAWGAKNQIRLSMTKGCQDLVEFVLTDAIEAMFFDEDNL